MRVYKPNCTTSRAPGKYICPLLGSRYTENGTDVSYKDYIDCFGMADVDGMYVNDHFAVQPHFSVLCNVTKDIAG